MVMTVSHAMPSIPVKAEPPSVAAQAPSGPEWRLPYAAAQQEAKTTAHKVTQGVNS